MACAISEGMDVVWICGWGGGYNVLIARKGFGEPTADDTAMAQQLHDLGWMKEDYSDRIEKYVDFAFLAKATGRSQAELATR